MVNAVLRWVVPLAALLVLGPVAGLLTVSLRAPDGGVDTTLLLCGTPWRGILAGVGVFALAGVAGCISSRLHGAAAGLFAAGLVVMWGAWGTGSIDQILRRTQSAATFWTIAAEAVMVGVLGMLTAALVVGVARRPKGEGPAAGPGGASRTVDALLIGLRGSRGGPAGRGGGDDDEAHTSVTLFALTFGIVAAAAGAWLIARESLKGQTFAAAVVAGILAASIGRATAHRAPLTLFVLAVAVLAVASPIAATLVNFVPTSTGGARLAVSPTSQQVVAAARAGILLPLARPLPLDWLAGAFVGVPIGLSWAHSMVERHVPEHQPA